MIASSMERGNALRRGAHSFRPELKQLEWVREFNRRARHSSRIGSARHHAGKQWIPCCRDATVKRTLQVGFCQCVGPTFERCAVRLRRLGSCDTDVRVIEQDILEPSFPFAVGSRFAHDIHLELSPVVVDDAKRQVGDSLGHLRLLSIALVGYALAGKRTFRRGHHGNPSAPIPTFGHAIRSSIARPHGCNLMQPYRLTCPTCLTPR
jgi:hypothetical protein